MKLKKLLASILAVAMVLSTMSFTAFAAEEDTAAYVTPCYTDANGFWGEAQTYSTESLVIEIYEDETKIASASLNNVGGIIDGDVFVTWHINFGENNDEYWNVEWAAGYPKYDMNPTAVKLFADGTKVAENDVRFNGPDDLNKIVAIAEGYTGGVVAYTSLAEAMGSFNGRKVSVLRDVTESIEGFYGCTLTTNVEGGVTINSTYEDWISATDVNIGSGVTVVGGGVFFDGGETIIEGTVHITDTHYHGYDAKVTIQNGGNMIVDGAAHIRYNENSQAGLYIYGDDNDETVELDVSYYLGAYSGAFYAEDATIKTGYLLLDHDEEPDTYPAITMTLDNSNLEVVGVSATGQDDLTAIKDAQIVLKNGSALSVAGEYIADETVVATLDSKSSFTDVNGVAVPAPVEVTTYDELLTALDGDATTIIMMNDITGTATQSNGYGKSGINIKNGETLDGNGYALTLDGLNGGWNSAISTTGGTIRNLTINKGFRGVFVNHNSTFSAPVVLEDVIIDGPVYTISCDQGTNSGLTAKNCTFNGWTSYAATIGNVTFESCTFGEGSGYAYMRPYSDTTYTGCDFTEGYEIDSKAENVELKDCTIDGTPMTSEDIAELFGGSVEAKIGDSCYRTIAEALEAAQANDTITLLADAEISEATAFDKAITIDLNNNTLNMTAELGTLSNYNTAYLIKNDVTITNGNIAVSNNVMYDGNDHGLFHVFYQGGVLTLDKVTLNSDGFAAFGMFNIYGDMNIIDSELNITGTEDSERVIYTEEPGYLNVENSVINASNIKLYGIELWTDYDIDDASTINTTFYVASNLANAVKLTFEPTAKQEVYDIYVESVDGKTINRMSAVQVKFALDNTNMSYTLAPVDGVTLTNDIDDEEAYVFNFNPDASGPKIPVGTVTFGGYGAFNFTVDTAYEAKVKTAQLSDNIVEEYVPTPDPANEKQGEFDVTSSALTGKVTEAKRNVKVVIDYNNDITAENEADYNDMWVTITGSNGEEWIGYVGAAPATDVADDNIFYFDNTAEKAEMTFNVTAGYRYTVVVKGEGYRTARYSTVVDAADDALVLSFWNNAKDNFAFIENGVEHSRKKVTFLAGDIAQDNIIDKYDLAAVVSYFGFDNLRTTNPDYVKYDLNRDGKIDADDISYVLVSWGK